MVKYEWGRTPSTHQSHRNSRLPLTASVSIDKVPGFLSRVCSTTEHCEQGRTVYCHLCGSFNRIANVLVSSKTLSRACSAMNPTHRASNLRERTVTNSLCIFWSANEELTSTTGNSLPKARHTFLTKKYTKHSTAESCFFPLSSSPQGTTVRCGLSSHLKQYWKACHCSNIRGAEECADRGREDTLPAGIQLGFLRNTSKANIPTVLPFREKVSPTSFLQPLSVIKSLFPTPQHNSYT